MVYTGGCFFDCYLALATKIWEDCIGWDSGIIGWVVGELGDDDVGW